MDLESLRTGSEKILNCEVKDSEGLNDFQKIPSTSLTQTQQLAESCIGLPCFPGIKASEIDYVVDTILRELR